MIRPRTRPARRAAHRLAAALVVSLLAGLAGPARAQIIGRAFEFSGVAGYTWYDSRSNFEDAPVVAGSLTWRYSPLWAFELSGSVSRTEVRPIEEEAWFSTYGADLRMNVRQPHERIVPYLLAGLHVARSRIPGELVPGADPAAPDDLDRGSPSLGVGALFNVLGNQRLYARVQVRDTWFKERDSHEFSNHVSTVAGLTYVWGGKPRDSDVDGVRDWLDRCPETPLGCLVDANGCPTDADGDGICDGVDTCAVTPRGCTVDARGCPIDTTDGDGVCDALDRCPDTPKGARVDSTGCPTDADGDGVYDGLDRCESTPKGCVVDSAGCPSDADGDGVCDGVDVCPNTPSGVKANPGGCPAELGPREVELLETGVIRLQDINFKTGKAAILPASFALLDEVGKILVQYPALKFEIGGHSDNRGSKKLNDALSRSRADSVWIYLQSHHPTLPQSQFTTAGYGSSQPVSSNATEAGRAKNRRVEFKVLNPEALGAEREKRGFVPRGGTAPPRPGESAPADTTRR
jgi:outer membrane protein OmpA-like peptidoglycan-associated protein